MPDDRQMAIDLIDEACVAGARQARACAVLEIDVCTLRRWRRQQRDEQRLSDRRREAAADRVPANKLSPEERERILAVCSAPAYQSLPPSQIVPRLADEGEYLASESTFYRVLRAVFVNEVARFFHATFFCAVPSDSFSCGGFSQTSLIGVQFRVSPDQRSGRACLAAS